MIFATGSRSTRSTQSSRSTLSKALLGLSALSVLALAGCGIGTTTTAATGQGAYAMSGITHGGVNPVTGATVGLYVTANNGYGGAATFVTSATTGMDGSWNLTLPGTFLCPAGQYAYVVSTGGNTGGGVNPQAVLMSVVGACSSVYSGTTNSTYVGNPIWIDEITTAASAYALSGFMTVTTGAAPVVNISAPANNNAAAATTTAASGLAHAFANALALVNNNTGVPNTVNAHGGVIPQAEFFTLGNILQACINTTGSTGINTATANDGTGCGKLYSLTATPQATPLVATNTAQAALNLAHFPVLQGTTWTADCTSSTGGTTTQASCLYNLQAAAGAAYPNGLTSAPPDYVIAVRYPIGSGSTAASGTTVATPPVCPTSTFTSGICYPYHVALDFSDNVYVLSTDATVATLTTAANFTNLTGFANDGTPLFANSNDPTYAFEKFIATDAAGHVLSLNPGATASVAPNYLVTYNAAGGTVAATTLSTAAFPFGLAVDPSNNAYFGSSNANTNIRKLTYTNNGGTVSYTTANITSVAPTQGIYQSSFNNNLDLYLTGNATNGTATPLVFFLQNTGTLAAPVYVSGSLKNVALGSGVSGNAYGVGTDSNGNAYAIDSAGLFPITKVSGAAPTVGAAITTLPSATGTGYYNRYISVDGLNTVVTPDNGNGTSVTGVDVYDSADAISLGLYKGCYVVSKACGTTASTVPVYGARAAAIDSSGDVWIAVGTGRALTEYIGAVAPTWPGLSLAKTGRPQ